MHSPPPEVYFCDQHGKAVQLAFVRHCNRHMGHAGRSDCILIPSPDRTGMDKEAIFLSFGPYILSISVIHASCGSKLSLWQFQLLVVRSLISRGSKGALNLDHKTRKRSPIHQILIIS